MTSGRGRVAPPRFASGGALVPARRIPVRRTCENTGSAGSVTTGGGHDGDGCAGSWHHGGGWVWRKVAPRLRAAGHVVYTPTLTGLGERVHLATRETGLTTHIDDIVNTLVFEELTDVVLAGHSYGGMVITGVVDRVPERIGRLIYLDAVVSEDGEALVDLLPLAVRLHDPAAFAAVPRDYLLFTADKGPGGPFAGIMDRSLARAAGWAITEVPTMHQITPDPDSKTEALLAIL